MAKMRVEAGQPYPLGVRWDGTGVNVALFSAHATNVTLCLFDRKGKREIERVALPERTNEIWHGRFPDLRPGQLYGFRVDGPYDPRNGHRFNANKLLIDPYAKALTGEIRWHDRCFGYRVDSSRRDLSFDRRDSANFMPKCIIVDEAATWGTERQPQTPWAETVIYEAHVKGMTALHPDVPERIRGTFAGLAEPAVIDYLVELGVTAIELQPIQAFFDDRHLVEKGLRNYWGYNNIGFFAPAPRYLTYGGGLEEVRLMVKRLHEAGIEVILDVVFNHTIEGNETGPTLCFRGIDNASYYMLADDPRYYFETTGCGNNLNLAHPRVLQMVMDCLRYWVTNFHIDGFRFDLATTLGRHRDHFDPGAVFFDTLRQDPLLASVKLIAEPWDLGPNGYQLGNFPPGCAEWNGAYRDAMRTFWRGDEGALPNFVRGMLGWADLFEGQARKASAGINFVTAHDGFTLNDLYTYNEKHNEANLEDNLDGHDDNRSWNCGVEGPTENSAVLQLRGRMRRNMLATLLLSQGTPMLLMGDERGRTQGGNNNAYCQDNEIAWMDWSPLSRRDAGLFEFTRMLIDFRRQHSLLRQEDFLHGSAVDDAGTKNVTWFKPDGHEMAEADWHNGYARVVGLMHAAAGRERLLILVNGYHETIPFHLPKGPSWVTRLRTDGEAVDESFKPGYAFALPGRAIVVFDGYKR